MGAGTTGAASRAVQDAELAVLALDARAAAHAVAFAQCAALRDQLLVYDLGARTCVLQARALLRRFRRHEVGDPSERVVTVAHAREVAAALPAHAACAFACSECRRIVNAVQDNTGKDVGFSELGLSSSMLRVTDSVCEGEMRCAKRSSAALRTALQLETAATARAVECEALGLDGAASARARVPADLRPASIVAHRAALSAAPAAAADDPGGGGEDASEVAKLRRDMKNAFEQRPRALACGDAPLVRIPLLGRVVRVYGDWYALCTYCGALARIAALNRYGGEPCCLRCDCAMLFGDSAERAVRQLRPQPTLQRCRFCCKAESEPGKWRRVRAPADSAGRNTAVPPPLRMCYYCPAHWRPWLPQAHRTLPTKLIFAHIIEKAKPLYGAETGKRTMAEASAHIEAEAAAAAAIAAGRPPPGKRRSRKRAGGPSSALRQKLVRRASGSDAGW